MPRPISGATCQDPEYGETSILAIEPVALKKELKNAKGTKF